MQEREPGEIVRLVPETPEIEQAIVEVLTEDANNDASSTDADDSD